MARSDKKRDKQHSGNAESAEQTPVNGKVEEMAEAPEAAAPGGAEATEAEPSLAERLAQVMAERDEYFDQLQRSRAEFINYRKRVEQERLRLAEVFTAEALRQFLPVIDDFERALANVPESEKDSSWISGISLIHQKLQGILERAGVQPVDSLNEPFDPSIHEAVATEPGSTGQVVTEVYQKGYKLGDTLLRAAMVKTGDASPETVGSTNAIFDA